MTRKETSSHPSRRNQPKKRGRKRKTAAKDGIQPKSQKVLDSDFIEDAMNGSGDGPEVIIEDIRSWNHDQNDAGNGADLPDATIGNIKPSVDDLDDHALDFVVDDNDLDSDYQLNDDDSSGLSIYPESALSDGVMLFNAADGVGETSFGVDAEVEDTFSAKISALLTLEPTDCFVQHSQGQKLFNSVMYDLARQMVASVDVVKHGPNNPLHRTHFQSCLEKFKTTYLTDFLARIPTEFRIHKKGKTYTSNAIIKKSCNDCFRALLRRKFRQACIASNTPIPFTFH